MSNEKDTPKQASGPYRIALFDDDPNAREYFSERFEEAGIRLALKCFQATLSKAPHLEEDLIAFKSQLIVVDLLMGGTTKDGVGLIKRLARIPELTGIPIVVCSKSFTGSEFGKKMEDEARDLPGVKGTFGKIPTYPKAADIVKIILSQGQ